MTNPVSTAQWTTYIDMPEVLSYLQFDPGVNPDPNKMQRMIDSACVTAQRLADRPFAPTQIQERHDGWERDFIMLRYFPVLQLVSCTEWQSGGNYISLPESTPETPTEGVQVEYPTGRLTRTFFNSNWPRPFFPGVRNIEVVYVAGFNPVPPDIWEATMDLIAYRWRSSQEAPTWWSRSGTDQYGGPQTNMLYPGVPNRIAEVFASYRSVNLE